MRKAAQTRAQNFKNVCAQLNNQCKGAPRGKNSARGALFKSDLPLRPRNMWCKVLLLLSYCKMQYFRKIMQSFIVKYAPLPFNCFKAAFFSCGRSAVIARLRLLQVRGHCPVVFIARPRLLQGFVNCAAAAGCPFFFCNAPCSIRILPKGIKSPRAAKIMSGAGHSRGKIVSLKMCIKAAKIYSKKQRTAFAARVQAAF